MRKITALVLSVIMIFCLAFSAGAVFLKNDSAQKDRTLRFNAEGKFTILQIADIQDCLLFRDMTKQYFEYLLDTVKPDIVVLTGDNIGPNTCFTKGMTKLTFDTFMNIFEKRGVKVASVFGNHDADRNALSKDEQLELYESYSCYIGGDVKELSGSGTYNLPVLSSEGDETAFNLWFFDSGEDNDENDLGGYGCVHKDQIDWYIETEKALAENNGGLPVPSMAFQHIIVPEVYEVLTEIENPNDEQYKDMLVVERLEKFYIFPEEFKNEDTFFNETPCPPNYSNGQADAFIENGRVLGVVSGHDHKNSFVIPYKGLDIIQSPTSSFGSYGDFNRGARVITLDEADLSKYETDVIFMKDYFDLSDPVIYNRFLYNSEGGSIHILEMLTAMVKCAFYKLIQDVQTIIRVLG